MANQVDALAEMRALLEKGDVKAILAVAQRAHKDEQAKAKAEQDAKIKATSGAVDVIHKAIKATVATESVARAFDALAKAYGTERKAVATFPLANPSGFELSTFARRASGGGGNGGGKVKDTYGLSLGQVFDRFATDEQKADYETLAKDDGNARYAAKVKVLQAAVASGELTPVK